MQTKELIYRVQELYSRGVPSDDSLLSNRLVYNKLLTARIRLIVEDATKQGKFITDWVTQTIPCVELVLAPIHECPCVPPLGCYILRTKEKLPKPVDLGLFSAITSVTSLDGQVVYSEIPWASKKYKSKNRFTAALPDYFIRNGYLYITWSRGPKVISITGIFEDPMKVEDYPSFCGNEGKDPCWSPLDMEFPIEDKYLEDLIRECAQEFIMLFKQGSTDEKNNAKDDTSHPHNG